MKNVLFTLLTATCFCCFADKSANQNWVTNQIVKYVDSNSVIRLTLDSTTTNCDKTVSELVSIISNRKNCQLVLNNRYSFNLNESYKIDQFDENGDCYVGMFYGKNGSTYTQDKIVLKVFPTLENYTVTKTTDQMASYDGVKQLIDKDYVEDLGFKTNDVVYEIQQYDSTNLTSRITDAKYYSYPKTLTDTRYAGYKNTASAYWPGLVTLGRGLKNAMSTTGALYNNGKSKEQFYSATIGDNYKKCYIRKSEWLGAEKDITALFVDSSNPWESPVQLPGAYVRVDRTSTPYLVYCIYNGITFDLTVDTSAVTESYVLPQMRVEPSIFEEFDSTRGYAYGQTCIKDGIEYRHLLTGNYHGAEWNSNHWQAVGLNTFNNNFKSKFEECIYNKYPMKIFNYDLVFTNCDEQIALNPYRFNNELCGMWGDGDSIETNNVGFELAFIIDNTKHKDLRIEYCNRVTVGTNCQIGACSAYIRDVENGQFNRSEAVIVDCESEDAFKLDCGVNYIMAERIAIENGTNIFHFVRKPIKKQYVGFGPFDN